MNKPLPKFHACKGRALMTSAVGGGRGQSKSVSVRTDGYYRLVHISDGEGFQYPKIFADVIFAWSLSKMISCFVTANPSQVRRNRQTQPSGIGQHRQRRRRWRLRQPRQAPDRDLQPVQGRRHEADLRAADLPAAAEAGPSNDGPDAEADRGRVPLLSPGDRS